MKNLHFKQKLIGLFLLTAVLSGNFSVFAQTRMKATNNQTCNSGYSGTVNYTKTVTVNSTGNHGSYSNMKRVYTANIVIRDEGKPQGTATASADGINGSFNFYGRSEASETETLNQLHATEKDEYCNITMKGRGAAQRQRCETKTNDQRQASGTGEQVNVFVGLRGRTMVLGIGNLPKLTGEVSRNSSSSCTGTCTPQKPVSSSSSVEVLNGGERTARTDEGVVQFNPASFNRLSGSWTRTNGNTVETFQWNLSRCAPPLEILGIRFEHRKVPNPTQWFGIDPLNGTIDGNIVKIKAKVVNNGGDTAYANVKFSETKSGENLPDGTISVALKPGESRDVEYDWDTNGYAWDENRKNLSEREIKAEIEGNSKTEKIKILPKPVIMVHGLWSNAAAWAEYPTYLREAHSFAWEGYAVGADPYVAKMDTGDHPGNYKPTNTIFQNAQELGKQIKFVREQKNAWHVDVVAHSMGGLISRQYINAFMAPVFDGKPEISHLVMLGTPNMGSPCADLVGNIFEFFEQMDMNAMRELRPSVVADFNRRTTNRKGVKFSILIGYAIPQTCQTEVRGDGVVPVMSARFNIVDRDYAFRDHLSLTDDMNFKRFVLPRLAIGPKKARTESAIVWFDNTYNETFAFGESGNLFQKTSFERETVNDSENFTNREKVVLPPKQTKEIEISANANGILIVAPTSVVATLTDANGAILGKSEGGTEAMKNLFRTINIDKKPSGAMKLKLENFANEEVTIFVAGFGASAANSSFTIEAGKPNAAGTIPLTAKIVENNAPVLNAKITAKIVGQEKEIRFFDDGKHLDGAANDGIYGASIEKLAKGEYFVEAEAEANNQTRAAVTMITVGGASTTVKGKGK